MFQGTKDNIQKHVDAEPVRHLSLLGDSVSALKQEIRKLAVEMGSQEETFEGYYTRHDRLLQRYGSHLLWKIDEYTERLERAKLGYETVIFSPPFLTAAHGYKLMASVALNGDGKGSVKPRI